MESHFLEFVPALAGFGAACVALFGGKNADRRRTGLSRITKTGWVTLTVAALAMVTSLLLTWRSQDALADLERQHKVLRSIAHSETRLALHTITGWFFLLFNEDTAESRFQLVPKNIFDKKTIYDAQGIDINKPLEIFSPPTTWAKLLQNSALNGSRQLTEVLQIYAPYIEPEVLALLSRLRTSEFLVIRLEELDDYVKMNEYVHELHFHFVDPPSMDHPMDTGYNEFWKILIQLDQLLELDKGRLKREVAP